MNKLILFLLLSTTIFCTSCEEENLNTFAANQFVVEAFLYAGEPIDDIRIKTTFPLTDIEDTSEPINDAMVILKKNGQAYPLISSGQEGFYHYPKEDLSVNAGEVFQLEVTHNGITATAETTVPSPTTGLSLTPNEISLPQIMPNIGGGGGGPGGGGNGGLRGALQNANITAIWENPNADLYFMVVESVTDTIIPIFPEFLADIFQRFRFVSAPTEDSELVFRGIGLETFGRHSIKVYHINQEYAALYENQEQDSRDLNEPPSNVQNALGIFSAFNSQEAFFEVIQE